MSKEDATPLNKTFSTQNFNDYANRNLTVAYLTSIPVHFRRKYRIFKSLKQKKS
jgi:hypothetical protein